MRIAFIATAMLAGACSLAAQETPPKWDVEIPGPIAGGTPAEPAPAPEPLGFTDLTSRTKQMDVVEAPEMPELPPVTGTINVTVKLVEDPQSPSPPPPPPPLEALPPTDPEVIARLEELRENYRGMELLFVSCEVHDRSRSLVRIYPNGKLDGEVVAWSNIDFNHFTGFSTYRVRDGVDGSLHDYGLLMGTGNRDSATMQRLAALAGHEYEAPKIPELPDLAAGGPAFVVIEGEAGSPGIATLEQLHDLYRKEGVRMAEACAAREQAREERKAYLLANPPQPSDVTVRFWRKPRPQAATTQSEVPSP